MYPVDSILDDYRYSQVKKQDLPFHCLSQIGLHKQDLDDSNNKEHAKVEGGKPMRLTPLENIRN